MCTVRNVSAVNGCFFAEEIVNFEALIDEYEGLVGCPFVGDSLSGATDHTKDLFAKMVVIGL